MDQPHHNLSDGPPIRVKMLMGKVPEAHWLRQLPHGKPEWGRCRFIFDKEATDYDWLVVYDDLPPVAGERFSQRQERLPGSRHNSLLITSEPSSIKSYGSAYVSQFGHVLTSQEPWALKHPQRIYAQPAMQWFYGVADDHLRDYDSLLAHVPTDKTGVISTVCSNKKQRHTLHQRRYGFTQELKALLPELEIFGRGVQAIDDKAEALDSYQYHITIENQIAPHHWTEKLADAFLGATLPFYHGCPNAADYFPEESFIPIDVFDTSGSYEIIARAIRDGEYQRRLPHILEARRRVLTEYNIFAVLAREIAARDQPGSSDGAVICARHALRKGSLWCTAQAFYEKALARAIFALKRS